MPGVNCGDFERPLMEMARGRLSDVALTAHLETCARCQAMFDRQVRLSRAVGVLAAEATQLSAPPRVERALLSELATVGVSGRRRFVYGLVGGAIAASLAVAAWLAYRPIPIAPLAIHTPASAAPPVLHLSEPPAPVALARLAVKRPKHAAKPAAQPEQPFIAIPYTLPLDPYERADVVRMDLPVTALIAAGLPMGALDPAARAQTDVLVGQDGRARAVRLISISSLN